MSLEEHGGDMEPAEPAKVISAVLTGGGAIFQLCALGYGTFTASRAFRQVDSRVRILRQTIDEYRASDRATHELEHAASKRVRSRREELGVHSDTIADDVPFMKTWILHAVAHSELGNVKATALLFIAGTVLATAGSIAGLF